ncbi:peptide/nickel transport system ATP-binding protein/oligopeptide transport system ATP-binding protein [Breoghania corrubedonensis]|uniref:Peptide/nickel transport system ATP-binding protein/oligopeptide transport system ATP-binding protein n=1 Tax=Breoghania corrubedonensis TaxID=665038 RepID=A0A2T5VC91_9HYPH|nr:ABC transporter ATP-binding protein [Breoghania corrubedonensis]PTW61356.1 peptide/nickel transport system ATP-binding protein/oligopeptide transport system ATP-binding protein [Breoghania corrubedonensis]
MAETAPVLKVRGLTTTFETAQGRVTAVDNVDLDVFSGEVLGLVGESGSGKSVTLRSLIRLIHAPGRVTGTVEWEGRNLVDLPDPALRRVRGGEIAMIFQEPMTALNPILPIRVQIDENLRAHTTMDAAQRRKRMLELMDIVGIPAAARRLEEYPHQYSGGMRQRAMIAIALASSPRLLLADEPTTALDVTIQDQILNLILDLREEFSMSVVLVTHDLGVVASTCDRVAVMYAGRIVETTSVHDIFARPHHAYTRGLIGSVPRGGSERTMLMSIEGTPPSLAHMPRGCSFNPRCTFATDKCASSVPHLEHIEPEHTVACFHHEAVARAGVSQ